MPVALLSIVSRFDGSQSLREILAEGASYGLTEELLFTVVGDFETLHYLETTETKRRWNDICDSYAALKVRAAAHAGNVYPADSSELSSVLESYLREGGVSPNASGGSVSTAAIVSPHIDYTRGWKGYTEAYQALAAAEEPDVIVLIGTSHQGSNGIFHLTQKSFESPLGLLPLAEDVVEGLGRAYGKDRSFGEEILHRTEHSLELQVPFIQHCYRGRKTPSIVPILVGSFHQYFFQDREPLEDAVVSDFVDALSEQLSLLEASGKKVTFFAGVDFAHVGTHFGDPEPCDVVRQRHVASRDKELLDAILQADPSALYSHMAEDQDARRICGYPSMYTMFSVMRRLDWSLSGQTLGYHQAIDEKSDCVVTFGSAVWHRQ